MSFRIAQRWLLILLIAVLQVAGLTLTMLWFAGVAGRELDRVERDRAGEYAAHVLHEIAHAAGARSGAPGDALATVLLTWPPADGIVWALGPSGGEVGPFPADPSRPEVRLGPSPPPRIARTNRQDGWLLTRLAGPDPAWCLVFAQIDPTLDSVAAGGSAGRRLRWAALAAAGVLGAFLTAGTVLLIGRYERRIDAHEGSIRDLMVGGAQRRRQSRRAVVQGLASLAESRDEATGQHLQRIRVFVRLLGMALVGRHPDIDEDFVGIMEETCALHDIGKVGVPDQVLLKPGPLTDAEREQIRRHPLIGGDTLLAMRKRWGDDDFIVTACEIVFAHHERWDGTGYPFGLAGEVIPIAARVVAVADVYDALTSARVYKEALSHDRAAEIIRAGAGTQFDPMVVEAFVRVEEDFRDVVEGGAE